MRTLEEVEQHLSAIHAAMTTIKKSVSLLENEYQVNAVELTGERVEQWDEIIENLNQARKDLNVMLHLEIDYKDLVREQ